MHGLQHNPLGPLPPRLSRKAIVGSDVRGTCRLLSDWSGVDVTGYPVVSIFDGWFFWEREWAREEENVWLGTRIMYQILIRGVRVCCRWTEGDACVKIKIIGIYHSQSPNPSHRKAPRCPQMNESSANVPPNHNVCPFALRAGSARCTSRSRGQCCGVCLSPRMNMT
jgi:hypothetical protein